MKRNYLFYSRCRYKQLYNEKKIKKQTYDSNSVAWVVKRVFFLFLDIQNEKAKKCNREKRFETLIKGRHPNGGQLYFLY